MTKLSEKYFNYNLMSEDELRKLTDDNIANIQKDFSVVKEKYDSKMKMANFLSGGHGHYSRNLDLVYMMDNIYAKISQLNLKLTKEDFDPENFKDSDPIPSWFNVTYTLTDNNGEKIYTYSYPCTGKYCAQSGCLDTKDELDLKTLFKRAFCDGCN